MATYKVKAVYTVSLHAYVEADSEDEAYQIAKDMDGGDFTQDQGDAFSDWDIYEVEEVK